MNAGVRNPGVKGIKRAVTRPDKSGRDRSEQGISTPVRTLQKCDSHSFLRLCFLLVDLQPARLPVIRQEEHFINGCLCTSTCEWQPALRHAAPTHQSRVRSGLVSRDNKVAYDWCELSILAVSLMSVRRGGWGQICVQKSIPAALSHTTPDRTTMQRSIRQQGSFRKVAKAML